MKTHSLLSSQPATSGRESETDVHQAIQFVVTVNNITWHLSQRKLFVDGKECNGGGREEGESCHKRVMFLLRGTVLFLRENVCMRVGGRTIRQGICLSDFVHLIVFSQSYYYYD